MKHDQENTAVVVQKAYEYALWIQNKVGSFPRSQRFLLGDRLISSSLDLLGALVQAAYDSRETVHLVSANRAGNLSRYLLRMSKDLRLISVRSYEHAAAQIFEIGAMIGGWRKYRDMKQ